MPFFSKVDKHEVPESLKNNSKITITNNIYEYNSKNNKQNENKFGPHTFQQIQSLDHQMYKHTIFQNCVHIFLYLLKYFVLIFKSINKGSPGVKNPGIMEMLGFGPSHNKTKIRLDQNWSE